MPLRGWIKRLEREARDEFIEIPQQDGTVARFTLSDFEAAFLRNAAILRARGLGEPEPEPHPVSLALTNAAAREPWHDSFDDMLEDTGPVEDLSE